MAVLVALGTPEFALSQTLGGTYRRPLGHDPQTLDPVRIADIYSRTVAQQVFDGLVQFDQTLAIAPGLAEFWRASRDGLTWTFTLRKGVKFHHGREVTAADVIYSLTRILDPANKSGAADLFLNIRGAKEFREGKSSQVSGLVAVDSKTVRVVLNEAHAPFVAALAVGHAKIVPREIVRQDPGGFGLRPIGTGPFKFVRWERGKEIVLEANQEYFGGAPRLSRVVYKVFPGDQWDGPFREFLRGNLEDVAPPARDYQRIIRDGQWLYVKRPMISVRFYGLNTRLKPLNDRLVRQALVYAIDRETLVRDIMFGRYALARGILPPGTLGFNPKLEGYPYDPEMARQLLRRAGYPEGRGLPPIHFWSSVRHEDILQQHEFIRRQLESVGVKAQFNYLTDWPAFSAGLGEGKFPAFLYAWYADVPDPDNFLSKLFHSQSPRNFFGYVNSRLDDLLAAARSEQDLHRRVELYRRAEQVVLDDAPLIPILHHTYERLFQPYVRSVEVNGLGDPYIPLRKIWLDRGERPAR